MRFPLRRFYQDERQTLGTLTVGEVTLFTLERPWLENQPNVSRIPAGRYRMTIVDVGDKKSIRLDGAGIRGERTLINIEIANHVVELQGCIGVGRGVMISGAPVGRLYALWDSQRAYRILFDEVAKRVDFGEGVACWLHVDDPGE